MTLRLLSTDQHNHLLSPKPQSPRDGGCGSSAVAAVLRSPRAASASSSSACRSSSSPRSKKMARGGLERSLSFKNWEAQLTGGGGINGARPGTLSLHQPQPLALIEYISPRPRVELDEAATKLQKVYKGLRTRRGIADSNIIAEELWWKAVDAVDLNIKSISFFHEEVPETAASRWSRAGKRVAKVGKGLSKDDKAQKLALQHWLEAIDPRHRYGHNLHLYYGV